MPIAIAGLTMAIDHEAWGYVAVLAISLVAFNVVYLPRRFIPMKYLLPGLFFLAVFGIYPVLYTVYASTTNYGTGHVLSKSQAIDQIQSQSVRPVEGATRLRHHAAEGRRRESSPDSPCSIPKPSSCSSARTPN